MNAIETKAQAAFPSWKYQEKSLCKTFVFVDFIDAFAFMTAVAIVAEKLDHHPNWENVYNKVTFRLQTHDQGDVTEKDFTLAAQIELRYVSHTIA